MNFCAHKSHQIMPVEIITKQDLSEFKSELLQDLKYLLRHQDKNAKQWLKSSEVRKLLNISAGTLQTLRVKGTLKFTRVGGTLYYAYDDIERVLNAKKDNQ